MRPQENHGFGLIGTLASIVVASTLSLGLVSSVNYAKKVSISIDQKTDLDQRLNFLEYILSRQRTCDRAIAITSLTLDPTRLPLPMDVYFPGGNFQSPGNWPPPEEKLLISQGQKLAPNYQIQRAEVTALQVLGPGAIAGTQANLATLEYEIWARGERNGNGMVSRVIGAPQIVGEIQLILDIDNNNVVQGCEDSRTAVSEEAACTSTGGRYFPGGFPRCATEVPVFNLGDTSVLRRGIQRWVASQSAANRSICPNGKFVTGWDTNFDLECFTLNVDGVQLQYDPNQCRDSAAFNTLSGGVSCTNNRVLVGAGRCCRLDSNQLFGTNQRSVTINTVDSISFETSVMFTRSVARYMGLTITPRNARQPTTRFLCPQTHPFLYSVQPVRFVENVPFVNCRMSGRGPAGAGTAGDCGAGDSDVTGDYGIYRVTCAKPSWTNPPPPPPGP